jgi:hypothetical protein
MVDDYLWLVLGDFNINKPGGDPNLMLGFNEAISKLRLVEVPLSGEAYTWSNKQHNPLLERLD